MLGKENNEESMTKIWWGEKKKEKKKTRKVNRKKFQRNFPPVLMGKMAYNFFNKIFKPIFTFFFSLSVSLIQAGKTFSPFFSRFPPKNPNSKQNPSIIHLTKILGWDHISYVWHSSMQISTFLPCRKCSRKRILRWHCDKGSYHVHLIWI